MPCCKPLRTWALHSRAGDEPVAYFGWVLHSYDGRSATWLAPIASCDHRHASRDEAQRCAESL